MKTLFTCMMRLVLAVAIFVIFLPSVTIASNVGGIIDSDTTWDLANSPYTIIAKVQIAFGVTLTNKDRSV